MHEIENWKIWITAGKAVKKKKKLKKMLPRRALPNGRKKFRLKSTIAQICQLKKKNIGKMS